jgi:ATP-binding cassette subfamily A (ABC1) protein 3
MGRKSVEHSEVIITGLKKKFGNFWAVNGLSFGVHQGELFGLLGVNGAGKSTTFKMLTGEIGFTAGNIWVGNKLNLRHHVEKLKNLIGYCPQDDYLIPELTGREMISMFARLRGIQESSIRSLVDSLALSIDLWVYLDKVCENYR